MSSFDYAYSPYPIRDDIPAVYREIWSHIAKPGCWYSGADRIAIARAVRKASSCSLCKTRKESLAPYSVAGRHEHDGVLDDAVIEVVHRVTTDSARLKKSWFDELLDDGLTDAQYVEIVAVVTHMVAVDEFHHALGLPLEPLPSAENGEPSGYRPAGATSPGAWVPMIGPDGAIGDEADLYGGSNRTAHVIMSLSLVPDAVRIATKTLDALYMGTDVPDASTNRGRALKRPQIELIAGRVSAINDCFY